MTVKELIDKLKEFPEEMAVLNDSYHDIRNVYENTYPYLPTSAPEKMHKEKFVILSEYKTKEIL